MISNVDVGFQYYIYLWGLCGEKIIHIAFALIFLINFTSIANAGKKIEIVNASTPAIYGDNLVYVRSKSVDGQYAYYQHDQYNSLYLYNLSTSEEIQLTLYEHATYGASIYGDKIVWSRSNQVNPGGYSTNISIYDIPTKRVSDISRIGRAGDGKIYENIVVWVEHKNGLMNIMDVYITGRF